jgi:hypothetical protein
MVNLRKTCISGGTFWGYETYVDIDNRRSLIDLISFTFLQYLAAFLSILTIKLIF